MRIGRRSALTLPGAFVLAGSLRPARAADKFVTIGIDLSLTGAAAEDATNMLHGALLAIEEANAKNRRQERFEIALDVERVPEPLRQLAHLVRTETGRHHGTSMKLSKP